MIRFDQPPFRLKRRGQLFFKKIVFDLESANLFVKLGLEGFGLLIRPMRGAGEQRFSPFQQLAFPVTNLRGMDLVMTRQLTSGVSLFESGKSHLRFELG